MRLIDSFGEDGRRSLDAIVADCLGDQDCASAFLKVVQDVDDHDAEAARMHECSGHMESAFMIERGGGPRDRQVRWVEGEPIPTFWFAGVKIAIRSRSP